MTEYKSPSDQMTRMEENYISSFPKNERREGMQKIRQKKTIIKPSKQKNIWHEDNGNDDVKLKQKRQNVWPPYGRKRFNHNIRGYH